MLAPLLNILFPLFARFFLFFPLLDRIRCENAEKINFHQRAACSLFEIHNNQHLRYRIVGRVGQSKICVTSFLYDPFSLKSLVWWIQPINNDSSCRYVSHNGVELFKGWNPSRCVLLIGTFSEISWHLLHLKAVLQSLIISPVHVLKFGDWLVSINHLQLLIKLGWISRYIQYAAIYVTSFLSIPCLSNSEHWSQRTS